jgi:hypothetical protein
MGKEFKIDGNLGIGELSAGSTKRRYEPECGINQHNERIHKESSYVDHHRNLPFQFSKPRKAGRRQHMECTECGYTVYVSINTVGIICSECKSYVNVKEVLMSD